jgi:hypothetical protein
MRSPSRRAMLHLMRTRELVHHGRHRQPSTPAARYECGRTYSSGRRRLAQMQWARAEANISYDRVACPISSASLHRALPIAGRVDRGRRRRRRGSRAAPRSLARGQSSASQGAYSSVSCVSDSGHPCCLRSSASSEKRTIDDSRSPPCGHAMDGAQFAIALNSSTLAPSSA